MAIDYTLRVTRRAKRITLKLVDGQLIIVSPRQLQQSRIDQILQHNNSWIQLQINKFQLNLANRIELGDGKSISLLGNPIAIKYEYGPRKFVELTSDTLIVTQHEGQHQEYLYKWLRKYAKRILPNRIMAFAAAYGYRVDKVSVRDQSTRWGSCSGRHAISINWRLIFAPINVLDYVVVHELAHLKFMNHSQNFWNEVAVMMPDYKNHRHWLKINGDSLQINL